MKIYPSYKKYKQTKCDWLSEIPDHWNLKRIKNVATYNDEALGEETDPDFKMEYVDISSVKWLNGIEKSESISFEKAPSRARRKVKDGDIIVSTVRTYLKAIAPINFPPENMIVSTGFAVIRPNENFHSGFAGYLLQSDGLIGEIVKNSTGVSYPAINASDFVRIRSVEPPVDEQQTIACFLDFKTAQLDKLISKKQALLKKLAEKRAALISHAVTKGLEHSVLIMDSKVTWLGKIPAHWNTKRLKFSVSTFGGGTPNTGKPEYWNGKIPWVSPKDMKCDFIEATADYLTDLGVAESAAKIVPKNSVLIVVRSGILRHTIPVARNTIEISLNQDMKAFLPSDLLHPGFLHWFINGLKDNLLPLWSKQGCTVESIEMDHILNTVIPLPPMNEQNAIIEYISKIASRINEQMTKITDAISSLTEYRNSLITHAVSGIIDVRGFKIP